MDEHDAFVEAAVKKQLGERMSETEKEILADVVLQVDEEAAEASAKMDAPAWIEGEHRAERTAGAEHSGPPESSSDVVADPPVNYMVEKSVVEKHPTTSKETRKVLLRGPLWLSERMRYSLALAFIHIVRGCLKLTIIPDDSYFQRDPVEIAINFVRGCILRPLAAYSFANQFYVPT